MNAKKTPNFREVVSGFPYYFDWNSDKQPHWDALFDRQVLRIREDMHDNHAQGDLVVYLSCPISNRGGGFYRTNVLISEHVAARLRESWGARFWVLNPTQYQMESSFGESLLRRHAKELGMDMETFKPRGGDYMRMWVKVLVEDQTGSNTLGRDVDAFYFLGMDDVHAFFREKTGVASITDAVDAYFSHKISTDPEYRKEFLDDSGRLKTERARAYLRYYSLSGGAGSSAGCRDEWNIWVLLNERRLHENQARRYVGPHLRLDPLRSPGIGYGIPGYFNGNQLSLADEVGQVEPGYGRHEAEVVDANRQPGGQADS